VERGAGGGGGKESERGTRGVRPSQAGDNQGKWDAPERLAWSLPCYPARSPGALQRRRARWGWGWDRHQSGAL
jgi:hypothetical protein